ncbi:MAG: hybrid sensor histidine kinase/response regulator transcription factor, partial [Phocaeicola sp.]
ERFVSTFAINEKPFRATQIIPMPSGKVWLTSERSGAICVVDSTNHYQWFDTTQGVLQSSCVNSVYEDSHSTSWLLTASGLLKQDADGKTTPYFFLSATQEEAISFYSVVETDTELWFGASKGVIWCYNLKENRFKRFHTGVESDILSIKPIHDNLFVILTSNDGFMICNKNRSDLAHFTQQSLPQLPSHEMKSCFIDSNSNIWLEMNCPGVAKYNLLTNKLDYYNPTIYRRNNDFAPQFFIQEDQSGRIWVHPHGFFSYYDEATNSLLPFYNDPFSVDWKFSDMLHDLFMDKQGNLWLGTRTGGLEKVVFDNEFFKLNDFYSSKLFSTGYEVRSFFEDRFQQIWIGNMDGAISIYNNKKELLGFLCQDGTLSKVGKKLDVLAYAICYDRNQQIWIGTKGQGVYKLTPLNNQGTHFSIKHYKHSATDGYSLSNDAVYDIHEDSEGRIWLGTYGGGLNLYDVEKERFINQHNTFVGVDSEEEGLRIRTVQSYKGKIYVGTTIGLIVYQYDAAKNAIVQVASYQKSASDHCSLPANDVYDLYVATTGDLYIATFGGGLSKITEWDEHGLPKRFKSYGQLDGLHSDIVLSIAEDKEQNLWINSEGNISRFDMARESFEQFNEVSRAISNQYFTEAIPLLASDGELMYGCTHGTLSFVPNRVWKDAFVPYLAITSFKVLNKEYPLDKQIDNTERISLSHNENIVSFEYAALDFNNPRTVLYAYKLEGFDQAWIDGQKQRAATYTNIPPGNYTFRVRSTNSNGTWVANERAISITIIPSFWQTYWAWLLYLLLFALVLFLVLRAIFIYYRMRDRVVMEHEQTELKSRFFTDISHEIRTPLTLIVTPIENLIESDSTAPHIKSQLQGVLKNTHRMLKMVNQILDFRKIQKQKLFIKEVALGKYVEEICETSFKGINREGLSFKVSNQIGLTKAWVDVESLEKLVVNLVSNSIKYMGSGKEIEVLLFKKGKELALQVKDDGKGMSAEIVNKLFVRFSSFNSDKSKPSTGIGLSMVKEIVDRHHARILVDSDLGKGTTITIWFQMGVEHFLQSEQVEILSTSEEPVADSSETKGSQEAIPVADAVAQEAPEVALQRVLVVEDDEELRAFIASILAPHYQVMEAENGKEGYEQVLKLMPDFILSDIMMPQVDGMTFLNEVRSNPNTSHIPFILLTAKSNMDDRMGGILSGADDYITKPFNAKLLIAKIENIMLQRKRLINHLTSNQSTTMGRDRVIEYPSTMHKSDEEVYLSTQPKLTEQDEQFIHFLREQIMDHLDNSEFTIEDLVMKTSFSRRVFFNKIKSLTGQAPVEFVREIRLKHAAELLKTHEYRVKEVAYMVGFSDIRYFTQRFKEMYGVTPSQYKEE